MKPSIENLLQGRDKHIIDNNTLVYRCSSNEIRIQLHETSILIFQDNSVVLNNGGWFSKTTKNRMNKYLGEFGFQILQKCENCRYHTNRNHQWFLCNTRRKTIIPYRNGMRMQIFTEEEWKKYV